MRNRRSAEQDNLADGTIKKGRTTANYYGRQDSPPGRLRRLNEQRPGLFGKPNVIAPNDQHPRDVYERTHVIDHGRLCRRDRRFI